MEDEATGTTLFAENFNARYGDSHPLFFHGTLDAAVREATHRPAKDVSLSLSFAHFHFSILLDKYIIMYVFIVDFTLFVFLAKDLGHVFAS